MPVQFRIIIQEHDIRKIRLPFEIPDSVEELTALICQTFALPGEVGLLYEDKDFGNQFFTLTSTADLEDKATLKIVYKEPLATLDLHSVDESGLSSTLSELDTNPDGCSSVDVSFTDDSASTTSQDTIILPASCRSSPWPVPFEIPTFSRDVEEASQDI